MLKINKKVLAGGVIAMTLALSANTQAKVSQEAADRLGKDLTPVGADPNANAEGTIPAWTGGFSRNYQIPSGYKPGDFHLNPFPDDKILFTIGADNLEQYKDHLSAGQIALINQYPATYKIHVYQSRRTAEMPQEVYDALKYNATHSELVPSGNGVVDMKIGTPFPVTENGLEMVWNHVTRYRGKAVYVYGASAAPLVDGAYTIVKDEGSLVFNSEFMGVKGHKLGNIVFFYEVKTTAPTRLAGDVLLVHETLDQSKEPRLAWTYSAGQHRVRRAPQVAFDTARGVDGMRTADNLDIYNGSPERYDWTYEGKKEVYLPYNMYEFASPKNSYKDILTRNHPNVEKMRFELHRCFVVTGKLKPGMKHVYAKRTFYIDEDSWQISLADQFDGKGKLWRVSEAYPINYYDAGIHWNIGETHHDLLARRYLIGTLSNEEKGPRDFTFASKPEAQLVNYSPSALRRAGIR